MLISRRLRKRVNQPCNVGSSRWSPLAVRKSRGISIRRRSFFSLFSVTSTVVLFAKCSRSSRLWMMPSFICKSSWTLIWTTWTVTRMKSKRALLRALVPTLQSLTPRTSTAPIPNKTSTIRSKLDNNLVVMRHRWPGRHQVKS